MVSQYSTEELKHYLRVGVCHLIATDSFEGFSTRKLSKYLGLSDPYIYRCYRSTTELMLDCFYVFDRKIAQEMKRAIHNSFTTFTTPEVIWSQCRTLWYAYWNYLIAHGEETVYHWRFVHSSYYTSEVDAERTRYYRSMLNFTRFLDRRYSVSTRANLRILMDNLVNVTIMNAIRVIKGETENSPQNVQTIFVMAFSPVYCQLYAEASTISKDEHTHER